MEAVQSLLLTTVIRRTNERIEELRKAGKVVDSELISEIREEVLGSVIEEANQLAPEFVSYFSEGAARQYKARRSNEQKVRRSNLKKWGGGFRDFDRLVAACDHLLHELGEATWDWLFAPDGEFSKGVRLLDGPGIGGNGLKAFLFLSMQARVCAIASEIRLLAEHGFPDGVRARVRSLYETVVIMGALTVAEQPNEYEVAERYCAWVTVESKKDQNSIESSFPGSEMRDDEDFAGMEDSARARWGGNFFKQHGWALPLFPGKSQVTFADLDRLVGSREMRYWYMHGNHAIHAGPTSVISRLDFKRTWDPILSGAEVDRATVSAMMRIAVHMVEVGSVASCRTLAAITGAYDFPFALNSIFECAEKCSDGFAKEA
ncbi:DUF5677 domain-containing protein [Streptomyces sp. NPDC017405]|uniref:DUF5677 domain-containing protein n=1 Tax=unclassified Streptomyces TaxID=2593676 RepID=UPI00378C2E92